jgi:hypothetical protein
VSIWESLVALNKRMGFDIENDNLFHFPVDLNDFIVSIDYPTATISVTEQLWNRTRPQIISFRVSVSEVLTLEGEC